MAERLTEHNETGLVLKLDEPQNEFEATKYIYKLAQLEDIMEKYGIESFELLEHIIKKGMVINPIIDDFAKEEYDKMKQDRDTWQKACELACKELEKRNCFAQDKQTRRIVDLKDYFYQQAKTEGNDE